MKKLPKVGRLQPVGSGEYGWDNGRIAFGDPLEMIDAHEEKKRKSREGYNVKYRDRKKAKAAKRSTDYHRKHG